MGATQSREDAADFFQNHGGQPVPGESTPSLPVDHEAASRASFVAPRVLEAGHDDEPK
jgi:hypothetical protein